MYTRTPSCSPLDKHVAPLPFTCLTILCTCSFTQALPDSLTQVIRRFGRQLDEWLRLAMEGLPNQLTNIKLDRKYSFSMQVLIFLCKYSFFLCKYSFFYASTHLPTRTERFTCEDSFWYTSTLFYANNHFFIQVLVYIQGHFSASRAYSFCMQVLFCMQEHSVSHARTNFYLQRKYSFLLTSFYLYVRSTHFYLYGNMYFTCKNVYLLSVLVYMCLDSCFAA